MSPQQSSGEKTEKATPKKRRDAREKGQIVKSADLVVALSMAVLFGGLLAFGGGIVNNTKLMMVEMFTMPIPEQLTKAALGALTLRLLTRFILIIAPILGTALLGGVVFNVLQSGFMFTPKAMAPKFSRVSPLEGFKRIFSKRTLIELVKSIIKITVLVTVAYSSYKQQLQSMPGMMTADISIGSLNVTVRAIVDIIFGVSFKLVLALVVMAPFDLFFQWWKHEKDLMMTKQEVKDEYKLTEGDPQIKGRIRQKQRQMSAMRMMQAVAGADVVITNPTHYAIALTYNEERNRAPVVVAKGRDYLAKKIKDEADKYSVPKIENRPLAQYLYFYCDIGDEVPEEMYKAVAEILAYIYKLRHDTGRQGVR